MYKNPRSTTDVIVEKRGKILLVLRGAEPHKGRLALPGGYVNFGENVESAAVREAKEETGLDVRLKCILGVYSDPKREPNYPEYYCVTTIFIAEIIGGELKAGDDAKEARFHDIEKIKKVDMAFDHYKIIQDYLKWKENGGTYWSSK